MSDRIKIKAADIIWAAVRIAAAAVCAFLLYTFIYTISLRQINVGNIAGCAYCGAVILLVILYPAMKRKKALHRVGVICGAGLAAFAVYCAVISSLILSEMRHGEDNAVAVSAQGTPQTVIVLGCMVLDGEPSPMLALRLQKAREYLEAHPDTVCIVTGGQGANESISEAAAMRRYLLDRGIEDSRIYTEDKSVNTAENIRFAAAVIEERGLPKDTVVVSECYHIYRGVRQARLTGLHASGIYPDPAPVLITMPSYWLREIFAVTRDLLFA